MNKLYSALISIYTIQDPDSFYGKETCPVRVVPESMWLIRELMGNCSGSLAQYRACVITAIAVQSEFRNEILELDPVNTYAWPPRNLSAGIEESDMNTAWLPSIQGMKKQYRYVDKDLTGQLTDDNIMSFTGAFCVQILRRLS